MLEPTPLYGGNAEFLDALYEQYLREPASVEPQWRAYFAQPRSAGGRRSARTRPVRAAHRRSAPRAAAALGVARQRRAMRARRPCRASSRCGSTAGTWSPRSIRSALMPRPRPRVLDLDYFGLTPADLDTEFYTGSRIEAVPQRMKLRDILAQLEYIYGGTVGAEFAHVSDSDERLWLQDRVPGGASAGHASAPRSAATSCGS